MEKIISRLIEIAENTYQKEGALQRFFRNERGRMQNLSDARKTSVWRGKGGYYNQIAKKDKALWMNDRESKRECKQYFIMKALFQ